MVALPVQLKVQVRVALMLFSVSGPLVGLPPFQPLEAVQLVAPRLDQLRIEEPPGVTVVGEAASVTAGAPAVPARGTSA